MRKSVRPEAHCSGREQKLTPQTKPRGIWAGQLMPTRALTPRDLNRKRNKLPPNSARSASHRQDVCLRNGTQTTTSGQLDQQTMLISHTSFALVVPIQRVINEDSTAAVQRITKPSPYPWQPPSGRRVSWFIASTPIAHARGQVQ